MTSTPSGPQAHRIDMARIHREVCGVDALLIVALKTDQPNIERRLRTILAATEPLEPDTEPVAWAKALDELVASDLDALAALVGWQAVERLRVGAVAGALATGESPDAPADLPDEQWFIPEGDRTCNVVHRLARATCMKRQGHEGSHATPQGTWIDGPWCEYPDAPEIA